MGSCWYLEHVTTRERIVLNKGENLMGRHSCCRITINNYDFVSRVHVKMTVCDAGVLVQSMNTSNGVYINEQKMKDQINHRLVVEGTIVSLGVEGHVTDVPRSYPIFVLRKVASVTEEIVLSSDDDDDLIPLQDSKVSQMIPDLTAIKKDTTDEDEHPSSSTLHLPKIPELKQELVTKTTEDIRDIFGVADEAILGSVMDINPYLYNQLNKQSGGTASTSAKIHDGDVIELDTDADNKVMQSPPPPETLEPVDDEYDEQLAISQAVLRGMKAEMAFSDGEEDFLSSNIIMCSPSSQANYDDIIIIDESDDDGLYDKVADWSNKLLSQKVPDTIEMSQTYPLMEDSGSDLESESRFGIKKLPKSLRIDSSSEDETSDPNLCKADSTSTLLRPCRVRIKSIAVQANLSETENRIQIVPPDSTSQSDERAGVQKSSISKPITSEEYNKGTLNDKVEPPKKLASARLRNRSKSCYMERPIDMDEFLENKDTHEKLGDILPEQRNESLEEVEDCREELVVTLQAPEEPEKATVKRGRGRPRLKKTHCLEEDKVKAPVRIRSARLLNRSRSCYVERPIDMDGPLASKRKNEDITENQRETRSRKLIKSIEEDIVEGALPVKKGPSSRLLNRSKSCFMDRPMHTNDPVEIINTEEISPDHSDSPKETRFTRGPSIIEAPFMPKNRRKLNNKDVQKATDRHRLLDQQQKNKKNVDQEIKEKRRDALKKLSDKPKDDENSPSTSNANKRKNCTKVPTVSNTNRGEFLTKEIVGSPAAKIAKIVEKPKVLTTPIKNSIPKRRSTIETCPEQLVTEDDLANYPQPHCSRPPERREAQEARNQRTCNRVNFADMERYHQKAEEAKRMEKLRKHIRFSDKVEFKYIDRVCGASKPVRKSKDSLKICLSTRSERREWTLDGNKMVNDIPYHKRTILTWANQWLKHGRVDAVPETHVLMPIPSDFTGFQQYRKTFLPLMKLELLTTIEREYKSSKTTLDLKVMDVSCEKECYRIVGRTNVLFTGRFELYTLSSGTELAETFATLLAQKTVDGTVCDMTFEIWMPVSLEKMKNLTQLTARPVVDSLRMELGALSAIHQLHRSPLIRRLLMPAEAVKTVQIPQTSEAFAYTGYSKLNKQQEDICLRVYKRVIDNGNPSVTLVQGPPGTGKSNILLNLSLQCLYGKASVMLDRKILICAHSNSAVDHMVKALSGALFAMSRDRFQLLRFGMAEIMNESSHQFSVEPHLRKFRTEKLTQTLTPESIASLEKQHCDLKAEIQQLKQIPKPMNTDLRDQLTQKERELLLISKQLNPPLTQREEFDIFRRCVNGAHIVCTTLSSCVKLSTYVDFFDICIIEEATQCTEPWTLLPMRFGIKHLVLAGDTQQLPAVVLSKKAIEFGLGNSMFDRIQNSLVKHLDQAGANHQFVHTKLFKLSMQYRMHPEICQWPNKYFYEDQLVNADLISKSSPLIPYCVVNLSYTRDSSGTNGNRSISNDEEARFVAQLLTEMDKHMTSKRYSYGLISPYSSQCHALSKVIPPHMNLKPQTVDSYQGLEKDVIIISNARTRGCSNYQLLNVALTRPRRCLVICGNFDDLESVDMWRQLLEDARQRKVYFDLKRKDVSDLRRSLINKLLVKPIVMAEDP